MTYDDQDFVSRDPLIERVLIGSEEISSRRRASSSALS